MGFVVGTLSWRTGSETMVGICGTLLGIIAIVIAVTVEYLHRNDVAAEATLGLFSLGMSVFLVASEKFSEALDFNDNARYLFAIRFYNFGIVMILWGMAMLLFLFSYLIPSVLLFAFSVYWLREIVRSARIPRGKDHKSP
jgi:hypothetical protein